MSESEQMAEELRKESEKMQSERLDFLMHFGPWS